jgi:hypothetical protein
MSYAVVKSWACGLVVVVVLGFNQDWACHLWHLCLSICHMSLLFVKLIMLCYGLSSWNGTTMCLCVFNIFL